MGQECDWQRRDYSSLGPLAHPTAGFDTSRNEVVLFGGWSGEYNDGSPVYSRETWAWDGESWRLAASDGPSARWRTAGAFDSKRGEFIIFGGYDGLSRDDTWAWTGHRWALRAVGGPDALNDHSMVFDAAREEVVLFGGFDGDPSDDNSLYSGKTWVWNGITWRLASTTGPSPRDAAAMAYDPLRERVVLFGGRGAGARVWEWDGLTWAAVSTPAGPSSRYGSAMAFDPSRAVVVLTGGLTSSGPSHQVWEWNGTEWSRLADDPFPQAAYGHVMTYHGGESHMLLFEDFFNDQFDRVGMTWLRACPFQCRADVNGDGRVDTQDVIAYLGYWAQGDGQADWDRDGTVTTLDLLAFLNDWATGC